MPELSVLIAARNEEWLAETVADVLRNRRGNTNVIVVFDGEHQNYWLVDGARVVYLDVEAWARPPWNQDQRDEPDVIALCLPQAIGQRAAINLAARVARSKYIAKLDAHCSVSEGFDIALIKAAQELGEDVTQIPEQANLWIYNRVCPTCGRKEHHGRMDSHCVTCGPVEWTREFVWRDKPNSTTRAWRFDTQPHFDYWHEFKKRPEVGGKRIYDVMTSLGACFFMSRDRFWQLGGLEEAHGSWGSFGIEVACKSWLSGGRHVVNRDARFSHFFRVGGLDVPYPLSAGEQQRAREYSRDLWFNNKWPGQVRPLSWLIEKFAPIPVWHEEKGAEDLAYVKRAGLEFLARQQGALLAATIAPGPTDSHVLEFPIAQAQEPRKAIVYYSDCRPESWVLEASRRSIERAGLPIIAVTLAPIHWPAALNVVVPLERGTEAMFKQILIGLELAKADVVFFAEHDCIYAPEHFQFTPPRADCYYYNLAWWKCDSVTGHAVTYESKQTSQLCAYRSLLLQHYRTRVERVEREGFSRKQGFEPGSHRRAERIDDVPSDVWRSAVPNIDVRHGKNLTPSRWSVTEFRDQRNCKGWTESSEIPMWGKTEGRFREFLAEVTQGAVQQAVA